MKDIDKIEDIDILLNCDVKEKREWLRHLLPSLVKIDDAFEDSLRKRED